MTERETPITARCKAWRSVLPVNPACEIIPAYDDSKLIEVGRDLKASGGMKLPVIVLVQPDGITLLDGRSRLDAMVHVGIKFDIKIVDGHVVIDAPGYDIPAPTEIPATPDFNAIAFVLSTNLHRRHLKSTDKRNITKDVIKAQPGLSDRAIAKIIGVDHKTVRAIRQEAYGEIPHKDDRVEATGRKARGRRPKIHLAPVTEPVDVTPTIPTVVDKPPAPPIVPIAAASVKSKPAGASGFDAEEALAQAHKVLAVFDRQISAPNWDAARKEVSRLIDLLLRHKALRPAATQAA
jgi:hypothetical protein